MNLNGKSLIGAMLSVALIGSVLAPGTINENKTAIAQAKDVIKAVAENKSTLKTFSITDNALDSIARMAQKDGTQAASKINELKGNDFEAAVNEVLADYYKTGNDTQLVAFEKIVDKKAETIVNQYSEAAEERKEEQQLDYEPNTAILSFGANVTESEIRAIVSDQYGEIEYIHECPDGTYMVKVNSIGLTSDKVAKVYAEYYETTSSEINPKLERTQEAADMINDAYRYNEYYLSHLNVGDAWNYINGRNHSRTRVAVIDGSGIDINENGDLSGVMNKAISISYREDGSYYPMTQNTTYFSTSNMHMINCAGLIAAQSNNGKMVAGVAAGTDNSIADLVGVSIPLYLDKLAMAVDYSNTIGAKVINLSLFHEGQYDYERDAISRFVNAGGTVVAGAGNNGADLDGYPSDYGNVISVIATNEDKTRRGTSNFGWECDVCAPGTNICVAGPRDEVWVTNGTSMASPIAAGVVTMMYSVNPSISPDRVKEILHTTSTDLGDPGRDYYYAYGLINAYAAVTAAGGSGGSVQNPTTTTTTQQPANGPEEVFGQVIASPSNNTINVVWGSNGTMESKGQVYNVYVDNNKKLSGVGCGSYNITDIVPGNHSVKITAVYNGKETSGVTGDVYVVGAVETTTVQQTTVKETTTQSVSTDGYVTAGENWTELNYWSVYFANGWANDPTGTYRNGNAYNNFGVYVGKASGIDWGIQLKTKEIGLVAGKSYTCKVKLTSNMATTEKLRIKEDKVAAEKLFSLASGNNEITLDFTSQDTALIVFDLGKAPQGMKLEITSFELINNDEVTTTVAPTTQTETTTQPETTTKRTYPDSFDAYSKIEAEDYAEKVGGVIDNNTSASNGKNLGGVTDGTQLRFDNVVFGEDSKGIEICYSSKNGDANGMAEIYVDNLDNKVGTVQLTNTGEDWSGYTNIKGEIDTTVAAGRHIIYVVFKTTSTQLYVANVDYIKFVPASEYIKTIEGGIEINGYQVNSTIGGMRTVYSVDSKINDLDVVSSGVVYALSDLMESDDIYVGSTNKYVHSFESTKDKGKLSANYSESDIASSYAMTMRFANQNPLEYTTTWKLKAYAKLSDGSYVYSNAITYTIFDIAHQLYQNSLMPNEVGHDYLHTTILSKVDSNYVKKDF